MPKVKPLGIDERVGLPTGETAIEKGPSDVQRGIDEEARNRTKGDLAASCGACSARIEIVNYGAWLISAPALWLRLDPCRRHRLCSRCAGGSGIRGAWLLRQG